MAVEPDAYAIWGDWNLQEFKVQMARWRDTTAPPPPADVFGHVNQWWRRLRQPLEWASALRAGPDGDPQGNLRWMWVPGAAWIDEDEGYFRVQCYFRVYERDRTPRLVCDGIRTVLSLTPPEIDDLG